MLVPLGFTVVVVLIGVALWLAYSAQTEVRELRRDLDETQRQLNELKAAAEVVPQPPPLPRTRSSDLADLREQLRAAHREDPTEE